MSKHVGFSKGNVCYNLWVISYMVIIIMWYMLVLAWSKLMIDILYWAFFRLSSGFLETWRLQGNQYTGVLALPRGQ